MCVTFMRLIEHGCLQLNKNGFGVLSGVDGPDIHEVMSALGAVTPSFISKTEYFQ